MPKLVRIKPYNPRAGNVLRKYTLSAHDGMRFDVDRGWYRVDDAIADVLRQVRMIDGDELSPYAFEICDEDEAKRINDAENQRKLNADKLGPSEAATPPRRERLVNETGAATAPAVEAPARVGQRRQAPSSQ